MMYTAHIDNMKAGWFIGSFSPAAFKTGACEVCYRTHPKGEYWAPHVHLESTEVNLITKGLMKFQDQILREGDIFVVPPWSISNPEFIEDTTIVCVRLPGKINDKVEIEFKNKENKE